MKFLTFIHNGQEKIGLLGPEGKDVFSISDVLGHERYTDMNRLKEEVTDEELKILSQVMMNETGQGSSSAWA